VGGVITGGVTAIGLATANKIRGEGAQVFIFGRRKPGPDLASSAMGRYIRAVQANIEKLLDLDRLYSAVKAQKGSLDMIWRTLLSPRLGASNTCKYL
jgi:NAD(P)-dependent dehydrogenase (short-subunit alcohol dehydrogenase family)